MSQWRSTVSAMSGMGSGERTIADKQCLDELGHNRCAVAMKGPVATSGEEGEARSARGGLGAPAPRDGASGSSRPRHGLSWQGRS